MNKRANWKLVTVAIVAGLVLSACGGGSSGRNNSNADPDAALLALFDQLFPFTPNQTFDVIYSCGRLGSSLEYIFDLKNNGTFDISITTNVGTDVIQSDGTYTYQNGQIRLQTGAPLGAILFNLDETTTQIVSAFGLVAAFQTPNMVCGAIGHRENAAVFGTTVHYDCPIINIQAVSDDENDFEFELRTIPFNLVVPGSVFRQRDRNITGTINPNILRGYGLYRRINNEFYVFFAPGTFDDFNALQGRFENGDLRATIDQLEPARGDCILR